MHRKAVQLQVHIVVHAKHFSKLMTNVEEIKRRIIELDVEHRDLDAVIEMLTLDGHHDQLQLRRLKKRKLQLKDYITLLKMQLVPDVPA
jgi:hypothetical protein